MDLRDLWLRTRKRIQGALGIELYTTFDNSNIANKKYLFTLLGNEEEERNQLILDCLRDHSALAISTFPDLVHFYQIIRENHRILPDILLFEITPDLSSQAIEALRFIIRSTSKPIWLLVRSNSVPKEEFQNMIASKAPENIRISWLKHPCQFSTELLAIWEAIRILDTQFHKTR